MVDFFDRCRFWGDNRTSKLLEKLRIYGILNRAIDIIANLCLPIYFRLTENKACNRLSENKREGQKVIVSLTSFPKRLPTLWLVIETILRQTVKPDEIVLYLTASQVPDINALPKSLLRLRERGLRIELAPDAIRSHTKYFYAFQQYPNDIVITVDDDLFYRSDLVETHLRNSNLYPNCVIANWVKEIIPGKGKYTEWPDLSRIQKRSKNFLVLGVASVLYPPSSVHPDAFDVENIKTLSLTADDVWLTAMLLKKRTEIVFSGYEYNHLPVRIKDNETLISGNYVRNQICVDNINQYYKEKTGIAPFIDLPIENSRNES